MILLDEEKIIKKDEVIKSSSSVLLATPQYAILASKYIKSIALSGLVWNGGEIPLSMKGVLGKITLKAIKTRNDTVHLQVRVYNDSDAPQTQTFLRTKTVNEKVTTKKQSINEQLQQNEPLGSVKTSDEEVEYL